ncbi:uncharacterized protein (DUF433 family) [Lewinella aquimaris]|uniref:Uncharacterized protein (DUF433 family) n=1 Tax=Neolewinella aquimaris TaxID=1835722 RepID=A0A840EBE7_9BACT|nr:uncharacterized protein (DUF433 family) [Neolewinella aquimaris]
MSRRTVDWKEYLESNPKSLLGNPIIKGSQLSVEFIVERLADDGLKVI